MRTHEQLVKKLMRRSGVHAEVERIECEESMLCNGLILPAPSKGRLYTVKRGDPND